MLQRYYKRRMANKAAAIKANQEIAGLRAERRAREEREAALRAEATAVAAEEGQGEAVPVHHAGEESGAVGENLTHLRCWLVGLVWDCSQGPKGPASRRAGCCAVL